jgi:hypothetical protein
MGSSRGVGKRQGVGLCGRVHVFGGREGEFIHPATCLCQSSASATCKYCGYAVVGGGEHIAPETQLKGGQVKDTCQLHI